MEDGKLKRKKCRAEELWDKHFFKFFWATYFLEDQRKALEQALLKLVALARSKNHLETLYEETFRVDCQIPRDLFIELKGIWQVIQDDEESRRWLLHRHLPDIGLVRFYWDFLDEGRASIRQFVPLSECEYVFGRVDDSSHFNIKLEGIDRVLEGVEGVDSVLGLRCLHYSSGSTIAVITMNHDQLIEKLTHFLKVKLPESTFIPVLAHLAHGERHLALDVPNFCFQLGKWSSWEKHVREKSGNLVADILLFPVLKEQLKRAGVPVREISFQP
ncbi:hypothetical protein KKF32_00895 [Patescibacteria group bacterium]|nr:hypothetical protein [Patescibacteria group bacterium]